MSWCRSYGCREHVDKKGDYCPECLHMLARAGHLPRSRDDVVTDGGRPDSDTHRAVCNECDLDLSGDEWTAEVFAEAHADKYGHSVDVKEVQ